MTRAALPALLLVLGGACGSTRAPARLRFPVPEAAACSRGFMPAARHFALDVPAPLGTPVRASGRGVIVRAARHPAYGLSAVIYHPELAAATYTLYAHLSTLWVQRGEVVEAGEPLGEVGETGNASAPHLHWEVWRAPAPLAVAPEGPLGIAGDAYRVDPAQAASGVPAGCRQSSGDISRAPAWPRR